MENLELPKKYAYCREVKHLDADIEPMLRVYRNSPATIELQIRTFGAVTETGRGTPKNMISGVSLSIDEARVLRAKIDEFMTEFGG